MKRIQCNIGGRGLGQIVLSTQIVILAIYGEDAWAIAFFVLMLASAMFGQDE